MKNSMFFNIYKNITSQSNRNDRVNRILHPIYFISLTDEPGSDTMRRYGHKLDTVYEVYPLQNGIIARAQKSDTKSKYRIITFLLNELIGKNSYYGMHFVISDDIAHKHVTSVNNWLKSQRFNDDDILNELIHIEESLSKFFAYRKNSFSVKWTPLVQNTLSKDLFVYSTLDIRNGKVKFLVAETDLLRTKYDAPTFATHYKLELSRKFLYSRHLLYLENTTQIESYYRWMESILEQYFPKFQGHIITWEAKDIYAMIENTLSNPQIDSLFSNEHIPWDTKDDYKEHILKATTGIIQHTIAEAHKAYLNFDPIKKTLKNTDKLGNKKELFNPNLSMLIQPVHKN